MYRIFHRINTVFTNQYIKFCHENVTKIPSNVTWALSLGLISLIPHIVVVTQILLLILETVEATMMLVMLLSVRLWQRFPSMCL